MRRRRRKLQWRRYYPFYSRYTTLSGFLSAYTSIDAICNAVNSFELMSGPASRFNNDFDVSDAALILNNSLLSVAKVASIFNSSNLTVANAASILSESALALARSGLIFESSNLSLSRIQSFITHANISDSKAQEILNATDWTVRDLTSVSAILYAVHDDWTDNKLADRDNRETTPATLLGANEFAQSFRPTWTESQGNVSAAGGHISGTGQAYFPSTFMIGTWQAFLNTIVNKYPTFCFIASGTIWDWAANDGYSFYVSLALFERLSRIDGGALTILIGTAGAGAADDYKVTRGTGGAFEFFHAAVSLGSCVDNTYTSSTYCIYAGMFNAGTYLDNLMMW